MLYNKIDSDSMDHFWTEKPNIIRSFIENRPKFEKLCEEVSYILKTRLKERAVEYAYVTNRTKTVNSFIEKAYRKNYQNPLEETTDIGGVRIIFLYKSDRPFIEEIITSEFEIIKKKDKIKDQETDRFGYADLQYRVKLGQLSSGPRYDDLIDLECEIQVRTVLQDAWSIIAHHLVYKKESEVPKEFRRELNSISAIFENADGQFDELKIKIDDYKRELKNKQLKKNELLDQEINYDTLYEYLHKKYPSTDPAPPQHLSVLIAELLRADYTNINKLDSELNRTKNALEAIEKELSRGRPVILHNVGKVRNSLSIIDDNYDRNRITPLAKEDTIKRKNFRHLIKD
jgi:ppGpp synthetase/RelA/SpoT-type nucleotidyltranferase